MDFWDLVFGNCTGFATIVTISPETGQPTDEFFYQWPEDRSHMNRFISTITNEDVYFSPLTFSEQRRTRENAKEAAVVYADADTCAPENFRVTPSISVQTSPGRWHCYWVLDGQYSADQVSEVAHKIAIAHRDQGCDISGWHKSKILRVPGTTNTKYDEPYTVQDSYSGEIYSLADLNEAYSDIEVAASTEIVSLDMPEGWPDLGDILDRVSMDSELARLFQHPWNNTLKAQGEDRSSIRWNLINEALESGFTPAEAAVLAYESRVNKYKDEGRGIEALFNQEVVKAASSNTKIPSARTLEIMASFTEDSEPEALPTEDAPPAFRSFLTDRERQNLVRCFVDSYVEWVATRTDAPADIQVANCFTLLSAVFSDVAFIAPKPGAMGLNLWNMILAPTTRSRKSTSRDLMLMVLHLLETYMNYQVDIGTDVTRESLTKTLAARDKQTTLVHKDEVQGYLKEIGVKAFRTGESEFFTDLYGGTVPVSIRNDKENKASGKRAKTNFLLYFVGVPEDTAAALTVDSFKSGYLARFVYTLSDVGEMDEDSEWVDQAEEFDSQGEIIDPALTTLVKRLQSMRTKMKRPSGAYPVKMSREALVRWNRFKYEMALATKGHRHFDAIEPSRQRLAFSTWKAAALIALADGEVMITLNHMIKAISYAEKWYANLVELAGRISASDWEAFTNEIEELVASQSRVRYTSIAKRFPNKRKREIDEGLQSLVAQGRIMDQTHPESGIRWIWIDKDED